MERREARSLVEFCDFPLPVEQVDDHVPSDIESNRLQYQSRVLDKQ